MEQPWPTYFCEMDWFGILISLFACTAQNWIWNLSFSQISRLSSCSALQNICIDILNRTHSLTNTWSLLNSFNSSCNASFIHIKFWVSVLLWHVHIHFYYSLLHRCSQQKLLLLQSLAVAAIIAVRIFFSFYQWFILLMSHFLYWFQSCDHAKISLLREI